MTSDHPLVDVIRSNRGAIGKSPNGRTVHAWAVLVLVCGHTIAYERLKNPTRRPPRRVRCPKCEA